jgi:hypothetical protein
LIRQLKQLAEIDIGHKLEGLRFSLLRATNEFDLLVASLREVESRNPLSASFEETFIALGRCWSILDCADRATRLARSIPFKQRSQESRRILNDLDKVRRFRNDLQHLEKNAAKFPKGAPPIMGALSWQHFEAPLTSHILSLASGSLQSNFSGLTFDRQEMRFVDDFVFSVFGAEISIGKISIGCRRYFEIVEEGLKDSGMTTDAIISPMILGFQMRFEQNGKA